MVLGGRQNGELLKSIIMLELWQFLEKLISEKDKKTYIFNEISFFMSLFGLHVYENTPLIKIDKDPSSKVWIYSEQHRFIKDVFF